MRDDPEQEMEGGSPNEGLISNSSRSGSDLFPEDTALVTHTPEDAVTLVKQLDGGVELGDATGVHDADPVVVEDSLEPVGNAQ